MAVIIAKERDLGEERIDEVLFDFLRCITVGDRPFVSGDSGASVCPNHAIHGLPAYGGLSVTPQVAVRFHPRCEVAVFKLMLDFVGFQRRGDDAEECLFGYRYY
ncbi:hypothetical protein D3C76_987910 [compost metagenome]